MSVQNLAQYSDLEHNTVDKGIKVGGKDNRERGTRGIYYSKQDRKYKAKKYRSTKYKKPCYL